MVVWTDPAKKALNKVYYFIAEDSKFHAKKVINKIIDYAEKLNDFPQMGRMVPEIEDLQVREIMVYSYRLIYQLENENISGLALLHGKQEFPENILN